MTLPDRILFLDIDGVMIPQRAYLLPNQTKQLVTVFDPCAVAMLNEACRKQKRKIVLHSSWIRTKFIENFVNGDVVAHCINQGIDASHFHPTDPYCDRDRSWRWGRISGWLKAHPETYDFVIIDDEPCPEGFYMKAHVIQTDFNEGLTVKIFNKLRDGSFPIRYNVAKEEKEMKYGDNGIGG